MRRADDSPGSPDSYDEPPDRPDAGPPWPRYSHPPGPLQKDIAKGARDDDPVPKVNQDDLARAVRERTLPEEPEDEPDQQPGQPKDDASGERADSRTADGHAPGDGPSESDRRPDVTAEEAEEWFRDTIRDVRLVQDFGTKEVVGVATSQPGTLSLRITRLESPTGNAARQATINLLADLVAQAAGYVAARPTGLDEAVRVVSVVADPRSIALKLCNAAGQALAHHLGLGPIAPALGSLVEQTLSREVDPDGGQPGVVQALGVFAVTVDVATGQLTPAAYDFAAAELGSILQDKTRGISQAELDKIQAAIRARRSSRDAGDHSV